MTDDQLRVQLAKIKPGEPYEIHALTLAKVLGRETLDKKAVKQAQQIAEECGCAFFYEEFSRELPRFERPTEDGSFI